MYETPRIDRNNPDKWDTMTGADAQRIHHSMESLSDDKGIRLMRDNRLRRLLDSRHNIIPEELQQLGIRFEGAWFVVLLFKCHVGGTYVDAGELNDGVCGKICGRIQEALDDGTMTPWIFTSEWDIYGIVNFNADAPELQRIRMIDMLEPVLEEIRNEGGPEVRAYVSRCGDSMYSISDLNSSVIFLNEYDTVLKSEQLVLTYERLTAANSKYDGKSDGLRGFEETERFISSVLKGHYFDAKRTLLGLTDYLLGEINIEVMPLSLAKARLGYMINLLDMAVDVIRLRVDPQIFSSLFPRLDFHGCSNVQEFCTIAGQIFDELTEQLDLMEDRNFAYSWVVDVKRYIDLHHNNTMMNVNFLAAEFHMNASYMSRVFRSRTGIGIPEYITEIRIRRAKSLLESGKTVAEVAETVGFGSVRTMSRIFQSHENITPAKYRANALHEDAESGKTETDI